MGHGHDHDHDHDHDHHASPAVEVVAPLLSTRPKPGPTGAFSPHEARQEGRLRLVAALVAVFFVAELAGAIAARSSVLQADALHLLMDVFALITSLVAMRVAVRRPTPRFTYGLRRAEPVVAIFNVALVLVATGEILANAVGALRGESRPEAAIMLYVAVGALVVNGISAWLLHDVIHPHEHSSDDAHAHAHGHAHGKKGHELNLRGARLHLLGDTLGSVAALVAALVIRFGGPVSADPLASFIVAAILVFGALRLLKDALLVLLEAAPPHLDVNEIRSVIEAQQGVVEIHDMHVWSLGAGHDAIVVHVHADGSQHPLLATSIAAHLRKVYAVEYATVQVEGPTEACGAPPSLFADSPSGEK
ncbi:MAG TPA: cation diffusion facilitator family transporter [Polyangiaceae bacterium]|nr:cation diffusion facilitator family transporter [Polyangiaceae bacterium]